MANQTSFYAEDTVILREDTSIVGIVEATWRDVDGDGMGHPRDWISTKDMTTDIAREFLKEGTPPKGFVVVRFAPPHLGIALVKEEDLILKDRALTIGDVVKRRPHDVQSGVVLKASETCLLEPIYTDLPYTGSIPWPYKAKDNMILVPAEDLEPTDWDNGDRIIFRDWIGEILYVVEEVTIRLGNGTVVKVNDTEKLEVPGFKGDTIPDKTDLTLVERLQIGRSKRQNYQNKDPLVTPSQYHIGQRVYTSKANLRLGTWKIGRYTPSQPPNGVVVDVRCIAIEVDWIATKLHDAGRASMDHPDDTIEWPELEEVRLYNKHNLTSRDGRTTNDLGTRFMNDTGAGDIVKFRDVAGAAAKYSELSPNRNETGVFRRIPRNITDGFDMNHFLVKNTTTTVKVQWQDGSITDELSSDLFPYLNVDDHDVWPREIISVKGNEIEGEDGLVQLNQIGIVQSVDAEERTARIKWLRDSKVSIYQHTPSCLFSGAHFGNISTEESILSLYDIVTYPALCKRRGDLVVISPHIDDVSGFSNTDDNSLTSDSNDILSRTEVRWFGEVVDMTADGKLLVRLGGLDDPEDILVQVTQVNVVIGADDPDGFDDTESYTDYTNSDDSSDEDDWSDDDAVEEIFYEGGERLDDGDEEAWTSDADDMDVDDTATDDQEPESEAKPKAKVQKESSKPDPRLELPQVITESNSKPLEDAEEPTLQPIPKSQFGLSAYNSMPPQFEILDNTPHHHHFLSYDAMPLTSSSLRALRREHNILSTSLPEGIWVRTWADRLDLVQVLILGPQGTPYALCPFLFDFQFQSDYPATAPQAHFYSWTNNIGRVNPNLYEDGKICLSVLGTWHHNEDDEGWTAGRSSLLQVLVSLLGLVLVEQPYYNEAGFESLIGAEETLVPARIYAERALCLSRGFIAHALTRDCGVLGGVARWLYRDEDGPQLILPIVKEMQDLLARRTTQTNGEAVDADKKPLSIGAEGLLRRVLPVLESIAAHIIVSTPKSTFWIR